MTVKKTLSFLLAALMLTVTALAASAAGYIASVTVSSFPVPEDGMKIPAALSVSTGSIGIVEWYLTDEGAVLLTGEDVFRAGHSYSADISLVPPAGSEWNPTFIGETMIYDVPDVKVTVRDTAGSSLKVNVVHIEADGSLLINVPVVCPGEPHDEELPETDPTPLSAPEPEKARPDFCDVEPGVWYFDWVYGAAELGLVNGKGKSGDGKDIFDPDGQITFAETAKLAACLHQLYTDGTVTLQNGDPWYKTYADYCGANGILSSSAENGGITVDEVMKRSSEAVTRAEFAWIFARALPAAALPTKNTVADNAIPDVKAGDGFWASSVYTLYRAGILNGSDADGTYHPGDPIQRSAVAAIAVRMIRADERVNAPKNMQG